MSQTDTRITAKAAECVGEFIEDVRDADYARRLAPQLLNKRLADVSVDHRPIEDEILCYGGYCIARNSENYIRTRRFFVFEQRDARGYAQYRSAISHSLLSELQASSNTNGFTQYFSANLPTPSIPEQMSASSAEEGPAYAQMLHSQFKVPVFAGRLATIVKKLVTAKDAKYILYVDLLPFGRQIAEITADIAKKVWILAK